MQTVIDNLTRSDFVNLNGPILVGDVSVLEGSNPSSLLVKVAAAAAFTCCTRSG